MRAIKRYGWLALWVSCGCGSLGGGIWILTKTLEPFFIFVALLPVTLFLLVALSEWEHIRKSNV